MLKVTCLIPNLLTPFSHLESVELPDLHHLFRLLSRSDQYSAKKVAWEQLLMQLFALNFENDPPVAAFTRLADGGASDEHWWIRADPASIRVGREGLTLFSGAGLSIELDEAKQLAAHFNQTFLPEGWQLEVLNPIRWYLRVPAEAQSVKTVSLHQAQGRDIRSLLPSGEAQSIWSKLLNETQMLFHDHSVNLKRQSVGLPEINTVWFWGGGRLLPVNSPTFSKIWADDPLLKGIATHGKLDIEPLPGAPAAVLKNLVAGHHLFVLDQLHAVDTSHWLGSIKQLENQWFKPLWNGLANGKISELTIKTGEETNFTALPQHRWRFWRKPSFV